MTLAHLLKPGFDGSENPRGDRFKAILSDLEAIAGGTAPSGGGTPRPAVAAAEPPGAKDAFFAALDDETLQHWIGRYHGWPKGKINAR